MMSVAEPMPVMMPEISSNSGNPVLGGAISRNVPTHDRHAPTHSRVRVV